MLQVSYIRNNRDHVLERLAVKNFKQPELVDEIIQRDVEFRSLTDRLQIETNAYNNLSKEVGLLRMSGQIDKAKVLEEKNKTKGFILNDWKRQLSDIGNELNEMLVQLPNLPHSSVPRGNTPEENEPVFENLDIPTLPFTAQPHWDLAKKYDIIDFELGNKITGAGFPVYKGKGAKLQRALISFFLDEAEKAGYNEVMVPHLVNEASAKGTGQLPDKEGQMYFVGVDKLYLIPTAEVPITNIYRDIIVKSEQLPIKNCGYTPCFRREAGSYGSDVRGLNRLHQFDKVEIVQVAHPSDSYQIHKQMCDHVENLLKKLELPYRILRLCGGDMSFTAALTFDFETWSAAQKKWLEVSSVSNFETFQSNRLNLRFKNDKGKSENVHTLNGSALALPRILATILENNQSHHGIKIPEVLVPYTKFEWIN